MRRGALRDPAPGDPCPFPVQGLFCPDMKKRPERWGSEVTRPSSLGCGAGLSATDTIDQIAEAAIVPARACSQNCKVPHIQATESSATVPAAVLLSKAPHTSPCESPLDAPHRAGFRF